MTSSGRLPSSGNVKRGRAPGGGGGLRYSAAVRSSETLDGYSYWNQVDAHGHPGDAIGRDGATNRRGRRGHGIAPHYGARRGRGFSGYVSSLGPRQSDAVEGAKSVARGVSPQSFSYRSEPAYRPYARYRSDSGARFMGDRSPSAAHGGGRSRPNKRTATSSGRASSVERLGEKPSSWVPQGQMLCRHWAFKGACKRLSTCRFNHDLQLVAKEAAAHQRGIYAVYSTTVVPNETDRQALGVGAGVPIVEIYTTSQDKTVKRWFLYPAEKASLDTPAVADSTGLLLPGTKDMHGAGRDRSVLSETKGAPELRFSLGSTIELESACISLYFGQNCLVCGLNNGVVKVFDRSEGGRSFTLLGHTAEVHCALFIDHVLVTGDWSGSLRLWKPDPVEKTFVQTCALELQSPITCFTEISLGMEAGVGNASDRYLWVGCSGGIKVIDLMALSVSRTIDIEIVPDAGLHKLADQASRCAENKDRGDIVMSLVAIEQHVVCGLLSGRIKVFCARTGEEISYLQRLPGPGETTCSSDMSAHGTLSSNNGCGRLVEKRLQRSLCSMTLSSSEEGPVLVCGMAQGAFIIVALPDLFEKLTVKFHNKDIRAVHNIGGNPSYFVTGAFDGSVCLWRWRRPVRAVEEL